ncbi:oxidoreductase-like protein [Leptomonas pyrrhocoris]|uniref:Oxidoreductase-like protein n=1 Tax=Leptomonas pyrrhocoris TaxID=157538 RepID=A0A0N0DYI6_LEPPY|nr:oxidoreductase-like protein [Leptomonas pyrrhocoris]KPA84042.1 oxidoreductase-like protein [Leptomonas pyrrhocoris]|eukprot:XP_015662481.1 oxidoreductase-like protein [Leptomonas pyrrhocoris]
MRKELLRIGFLGASSIARKVFHAVLSAGHRVTCIGCRDEANGIALIDAVRKEMGALEKRKEDAGGGPRLAFAAPRIGSYIDVLRADDVDVVYISLPTAKRAPWIRLCAEYGKHVVSEKPAATSAAVLAECLQALASQRLLFVDGTTLTHGQRLQDVRRAVAQLGGPRHINAHMSFNASPSFMSSDIRMQPQLEPHGALGDLGWYGIRWILHVMDFALPTGVTGRVTECDALHEETANTSAKAGGLANPAGSAPPSTTVKRGKTSKSKALPALTGFEGNLEFTVPAAAVSSDPNRGGAAPSIVTASFQCSFHSCHDQTVEIFCRDGTVTVYSAINPTGEDRPRFHLRRDKAAPEPDAATRNEDISAPNAKDVFQVYEHVEEEENEMVYSTAPDEQDGMFQMVQLWRHVGESIMRLGKGEPLIADAELAKKWSTFAFVTQVVMDRALEAAGQHAAAIPAAEGKA